MNMFEINRFKNPDYDILPDKYDPFFCNDISTFHNSLPGYSITPLFYRQRLAQQLGLRTLYIKDESARLGLKAFKCLGASYAIFRHLADNGLVDRTQYYSRENRPPSGSITFCTATDGNHGRAVAWMAKQYGQKAVIFMPEATVPDRIKNIENEGAEVRIVKGSYDETVQVADERARANNWELIADTAYGDYTKIPNNIMAGLNCGSPSITAWPILKNTLDLFIAISDEYAKDAMKLYYYPEGGDARIISGESGAAGLAGLLALLRAPDLKDARDYLQINGSTRILVISTEGNTDPDSFRRIVLSDG
ncbi:MAG: pyridoxal-phosphate dependent enzyme [candidate division Zixibacteria bacterium]|nr:pyridoxal-phosphate dependent enzyme [candidate division Zixibacteria bacterium]